MSGHRQVAQMSAGRVSDPDSRFERLTHKAPGFAGGYSGRDRMTLTKAELAELLFEQVGLNKREAKDMVETAFSTRSAARSRRRKAVKLSGFGNFQLRDKPQRPGRNPKTGEEIPITARRVVTFHASQKLKAMVEKAHLEAIARPAAKAVLPPIPAKRYFTIGEVSDLCGVKPHVLRYWEQEFTQLRPIKRRGNRRYYQHHEVLLIRRIRGSSTNRASPSAARAIASLRRASRPAAARRPS